MPNSIFLFPFSFYQKGCGPAVETLRKRVGKPTVFFTHSTVFKKYLSTQVFLCPNFCLVLVKLCAICKQPTLAFYNLSASSLSALSSAPTNTTKLIKEI